MIIEFLFYTDCPSHEEALQRLQDVMEEHAESAALRIIRVTTEEEAEELEFPGSPTIRIDDVDIDPEGDKPPYNLGCRVYRKADGTPTPLPPVELIQQAIEAA